MRPAPMTEIARILAALDSARGQPAALATLVQLEGSSYRRPGARLLLLADGTCIGSISGGCLDEDVIARARRVLERGTPELAVYDTTAENDLVWGVGLGCQGVVRIFLERIPAERPDWVSVLAANQQARRDTAIEVKFAGAEPTGTRLSSHSSSPVTSFQEIIPAPPSLLICGAGDDAQPLVRLAKDTGWHVTVADVRPAYVTRERFPRADRLFAGTADGVIGDLALDARMFAVVMTHRFEDDAFFLRALLSVDLRYLGQLGPRKRTERLLSKLAAEGFSAEPLRLQKLHAPVGLDLGGTTPESVALAILGEMQARLAGRMPGFLRDRDGPIHD